MKTWKCTPLQYYYIFTYIFMLNLYYYYSLYLITFTSYLHLFSSTLCLYYFPLWLFCFHYYFYTSIYLFSFISIILPRLFILRHILSLWQPHPFRFCCYTVGFNWDGLNFPNNFLKTKIEIFPLKLRIPLIFVEEVFQVLCILYAN